MSGKINAELVLIPSPGRGHLLATLEMAKLLIHRDERLSITVLVIKPFYDSKSSAHSVSRRHSQPNPRIRFVDVPPPAEPPSSSADSPVSFHSRFIESHKDHVTIEVAKIVRGLTDSRRVLAGLVVDVFCTSMIDVANEFNVATYVFFTSGASFLGLMFHFQGLRDYQILDPKVYENSSDQVLIPSYIFPVPAKLLPDVMFQSPMLLDHANRFRETKRIMVNTFQELEIQAMKSLPEDENIPPAYPIGPILHVDSDDNRDQKHVEIMKWLDGQADLSVVFLCFGSKGCFDEIQVKEIASALERSGHTFLWSLRRPPWGENKFETPGEYENPGEILPEGFTHTLPLGYHSIHDCLVYLCLVYL